MTDLKISQFANGGAIQDTDEVATSRAGVNTKVFVGTAAAKDIGTSGDQVPTNDDLGTMAFEDTASYTPTAGLGTAAFLDVGVTGGDVVQFDSDSSGNPLYPAADGSQITNLPSASNTFQTIAVSGQSDVVADSPTDTLTLVAGTNVTITTNATTDEVTINSTASGGTTLGTPQATTSGTSIDFTSIPSNAKRITVTFSSVSTSGTSPIIVQIGDSGGVETTGYLGTSINLPSGTTAQETTGFGVQGTVTSPASIHGAIYINLQDTSTNTWVSNSLMARSDSAVVIFGAGSKSLSSTLDRVRITTVGGSDTFDAGKMNIIYEV